MRPVMVSSLFLLLAACASSPESREVEPDTRFEVIARAWAGAHINDMIAVWGDPRRIEREEDKGGAGRATWAIFSKYGNPRTRCEATATFDAAGLIRNIDVVSVNCPPERAFSWRENWDIDQLRRPGTT